MSKVMRPTPLSSLLRRMAGAYLAKDSIYEVPGELFRGLFAAEDEGPGLEVMSGKHNTHVLEGHS